jgi:hypothetical protein
LHGPDRLARRVIELAKAALHRRGHVLLGRRTPPAQEPGRAAPPPAFFRAAPRSTEARRSALQPPILVRLVFIRQRGLQRPKENHDHRSQHEDGCNQKPGWYPAEHVAAESRYPFHIALHLPAVALLCQLNDSDTQMPQPSLSADGIALPSLLGVPQLSRACDGRQEAGQRRGRGFPRAAGRLCPYASGWDHSVSCSTSWLSCSHWAVCCT